MMMTLTFQIAPLNVIIIIIILTLLLAFLFSRLTIRLRNVILRHKKILPEPVLLATSRHHRSRLSGAQNSTNNLHKAPGVTKGQQQGKGEILCLISWELSSLPNAALQPK